MCVCTWACMCMQGPEVNFRYHSSAKSPSPHFFFFFWRVSHLSGIANWKRLAGHRAPWVRLILAPQLWDYNHWAPHSAFSQGFRGLNSGLCVHMTSPSLTEFSPTIQKLSVLFATLYTPSPNYAHTQMGASIETKWERQNIRCAYSIVYVYALQRV